MKRSAVIVSLGCAKNLVDSETLAPQLVDLDYCMTSEPSEASLILVNTCGFLESAVQEAVQTILQLSRHKETGSCDRLVVTGCMVQRYGKKLLDLLPEVDLFLGTSHYQELGTALRAAESTDSRRLWIGRPRHLPTAATPRLQSTPRHWAYIKIAEGCSNRCAFCMIPRLRGPYRSRTVEDVLEEAARLSAAGVAELNLIAQDITAFGSDLGRPFALMELLESLDRLEGAGWIRLLYAYPTSIGDSLLRTMSQSSKVLPYLDVPLQHCVPGILEAMHRGMSAPDVERLIERIRCHLPEITLRTSLMVGFPGETDEDFRELLRFVERMEFDHIGVFAFSPEPGAKAAGFSGQVSSEVKEERRSMLLELQQEISRRRLRRFVGRTLPVLIEGPHPETDLLLVGRLPSQAPEVDGTVLITRGVGDAGRVAYCRVTASHEYDLEAELLSDVGQVTGPTGKVPVSSEQ